MPSAVSVRGDFTAEQLRRLAAATKNANQSRRLLSIAAVLDGMNRTQAARIGGMDRQTLRDWVHRFNDDGPEGLLDHWSQGPSPRLSAEQRAEIARLVETGPDRAVHGVVRWRRVDLQRLIAERFGVVYHERTVGKILHQLGFSPISARPRHPGQDDRIVAEFKKTSRPRWARTSPGSRRASRSRFGSKMKRALARRTGASGNGPDADQGPASPPIGATRAPTFSARSARPTEKVRRWRCPLPTRRPCNSTSARSRAPSPEERMPCCCSTGPAGTPQATSSCRRT